MSVNPSGIALHHVFKRQLPILPGFDSIAQNYQRYRIPRPPEFDPEGTEPGKICWGTVGAMPSPEALGTTGFTVKENWQETRRKSQKVRIENPDDPEQYVIEDRPTEVTFKKTISDGDGNTWTSENITVASPEWSGLMSQFEAREYEAIMKYQVTGIQGG